MCWSQSAYVLTCYHGQAESYQGLASSATTTSNIERTGALVRVPIDDNGLNSACDPISENYTDQIAVIDRGHCDFTAKLLNVQSQGAIGAIICNFDPNPMLMDVDNNQINIPTVSLGMQDCTAILTNMTNGQVEASLSFSSQMTSPCELAVGITSEAGSVYVKNMDGIILVGKDGNCYLISIDINGEISKEIVTCPSD